MHVLKVKYMSYITVEANYSPSHYTSWMKPSCSVIFLKKPSFDSSQTKANKKTNYCLTGIEL